VTDLATLVLEIDSSSVPKGTAALDDLTAAGKRAETATTGLAGSTKGAAAAATQMAAEAQGVARAATVGAAGLHGFGLAGNNARIVGLEMAHVTRAMTEQIAMGVSPVRALTMELGRLSTAAQYAGGIGGLGRAVLAMIAPFSGLIAAAGLLGTALLGVKQATEDNAGLKRYAETLGLTKKEMGDLKDVTVTWGDVAGATFDVLAEKAGTSSAKITGAFHDAFLSIGEFGKFSAGVVLAAFAAAVKGVYSLFANLPGIVGNAAVAAANAALAAIETLVNKGIGAMNRLTAGVNSALGTSIPQIADVSLGRVSAKFSGTFSNVGKDIKSQFFGTFSDVEKGLDQISARANQRARNRIKSQADDIIEGRNPKGGRTGSGGAHAAKAKELSDEEKAYQSAMKAAEGYLTAIEKETDGIGQNAIVTKRMEVATAAASARKAAAIAPTQAMRAALLDEADAIERAGAAWESVFKGDQVNQFVKNTIEPLEFENSLIGKSVEQQRILRAERELTAGSIDKGSAAWNRYIAATEQAIANDNLAARQQQMLHWVDEFASGISDVITGTKSLGAAFKDIARSIIGDIIQMTIKMLIFRAISGIFGGGISGAVGGGGGAGVAGARASGGPVSGGQTYLVGERGPELFRPSSSGSIVPNNKLAANNNQGGPIEIKIGFGDAPAFAPFVQEVSAAHAKAAVSISVDHTNRTLKSIARTKLNGG
jgi:hypothetical protein